LATLTAEVRAVDIKECDCCGEIFEAHPRLGKRQRVCGREACRQWLVQEDQRRWRQNNRGYYTGAAERERVRQWATKRRYWESYRGKHPDYVERNRVATRERMRRRRALFAKQESIRKDPVGYLEGLRREAMFAKQESITSTIHDLILYMETPLGRFAKQDSMDGRLKTTV
jgi:hypothetical protein